MITLGWIWSFIKYETTPMILLMLGVMWVTIMCKKGNDR